MEITFGQGAEAFEDAAAVRTRVFVEEQGFKNEFGPEDAASIARALAEANGKADQHLESNTISQNEVVAVWRDAYQQFKTKKGARGL